MSPPSDSRPSAVPDLDATLDTLYRAPLAEFVSVRNAEAKRWKAIDRAVADGIKARAKPSISAWAINAVWWQHKAAFDALLDVGDQIRRAALDGAGPAAQQQLGAQRRKALQSLLRLSETVLSEAGHASGTAVMRRITTSFEACAAYGHALPDPGPGRLSADLAPPGFGVLSTLGPLPAREPTSPPTPRLVEPEPAPAPVESPTVRRWERELEQARSDERSRSTVLDEATRRADRLLAAGTDAEEAHTHAKSQLAAAVAEEERTRLLAAELGTQADAAERDRTRAKAELAEVRRAIADLERKLD